MVEAGAIAWKIGSGRVSVRVNVTGIEQAAFCGSVSREYWSSGGEVRERCCSKRFIVFISV